MLDTYRNWPRRYRRQNPELVRIMYFLFIFFLCRLRATTATAAQLLSPLLPDYITVFRSNDDDEVTYAFPDVMFSKLWRNELPFAVAIELTSTS